MDEETALKLASSFGGGIGRLREVCGGVTGAFAVLGLVCGYDDPTDTADKSRHYADIRELARRFTERSRGGSIVCREILKNPPTDPTPSPRTAEYYRVRPCARMVLVAGQLMDAFIAEHPLEN